MSPDPATIKMLDGIVKTELERNTLREKTEELTTSLAQAQNESAFLTERLKEVTDQRDFYMRHSVTLVTRLNDISMLIEQAREEAKQAALKTEPLQEEQPNG